MHGVRSLLFASVALPMIAFAADASKSADAVDAQGRKAGSITVEKAGEPWTVDGKTFATFTVVVRNATPQKAAFFGNISLDNGKAGDCTWFTVVEANASKRIEKPCKQRRAWNDFSVNARVEMPRPNPKATTTPTPTPEPFVP